MNQFLAIKKYIGKRGDYWLDIMYLQCTGEAPDDPRQNKGKSDGSHGGRKEYEKSNNKDSKPRIDPSGYVYEAVTSNRLAGVTTTIYERINNDVYGDLQMSATKWDADQYSQMNPQVTKEDGFYAWDVPIGWWQVKYEKEGYETLYSDWLPVPPPQLDINVGMRNATAPTVQRMRGFESGITVDMSKYMRPETFGEGNITVTRNGQLETGHIEMLNAEKEPTENREYASKVKFVPDVTFNTSDEVVVTVHKEVESYCGVPMGADHTETVKIELEVGQIVADSVINVTYQGTKTVEVMAIPKDASAGKTVRAVSSSPMIASLEQDAVVVDTDGKAIFSLHGELPGGALLMFVLDDADVTAETRVNVVMEQVVATPKASIRSGEMVNTGTTIELRSDTEGATIYYTTDGACPCDETRRLKYVGPITITQDVTIKAIAVKDGLADSDIATFVYVVNGGSGVAIAGHEKCRAALAGGQISWMQEVLNAVSTTSLGGCWQAVGWPRIVSV